jgi:hypothetical protein
MVKKVSAQLYLPNEQRIPVHYNHTDMAKLPTQSDTTYRLIANRLQKSVAKILKERGMSFS